MRLFEFVGPREYLTFCRLCTGMTIESITIEDTKRIATGKVIIMNTIGGGLVAKISWIAELAKNADWIVHKEANGSVNSDLISIGPANKHLKRFIIKWLKLFMASEREIEHDPADDLTPSCVKTISCVGTCPGCARTCQECDKAYSKSIQGML